MVKVVNDLAELTRLHSASRWKRHKHGSIRRFSRFMLTTCMFLTACVLVTTGMGRHEDGVHMISGVWSETPKPQNLWEKGKSHNNDDKKVRKDYAKVILDFMKTAPHESFSEPLIRSHYENDDNNMKNTTMMVTINKHGKATFTMAFDPSRHGRASSVAYMVRRIIEDRRKQKKPKLPKVTFLVMLSDGHRPRVATFGSARHWQNWNMMIPIPLGNNRGYHHGWGTPLENWDEYIDAHVRSTHDTYSWPEKITKAMFRGALGMQSYKLGTCNWQNHGACRRAMKWDQINRGVLYMKAKEAPNLFDVGFTTLKQKPMQPLHSFDDAPPSAQTYRFRDFQKFKYLLNVGSNQDWAERLRCLLFTNSAVIIHEAETREFFTPLLKPWVHYIPTNLMFTDLVLHVKWAANHDATIQRLVQSQNRFAHQYLSENAMQLYWEIAIEQFATRQREPKPSSPP